MPEEPGVSQEAHGSYIAQAAHGASATVNVYPSPSTLENQNRARFLVRLRTRYSSLLDQSRHGAVRMQMQLVGSPDAVAPPVRLLYESEQLLARPFPVGTSFLQIYEEAGHELLVLGGPGSGKSTLLLELAADLVGLAEQDQHQGLPVIVPLSSWASKRQPIEQWVAEQVALLYDLPRRLATRWVQQERLLLLLDGLDEMEEQARAACIAAINTDHHEHLHPLVVSSRKHEYEVAAAPARLALHSAAEAQPLTTKQVDAYLEQCGEPAAALRTILQTNVALQEIATAPLMLSILMLTYQGQAVEDLPISDSLPEQQQRIFTAYVERMMARKGTLTHGSPQQFVGWLGWLARQMCERHQTIFYLEHLQPDYLVSTGQRPYAWLAVRLPALLTGILASLFIILAPVSLGPAFLLQYAALAGLLGWFFSRSASAGSGIVLSGLRQKRFSRLSRDLLISVLGGLAIALSFGFYLGDHYGPGDWLFYGLTRGGVAGLCSLLLSWLLPSSPSRNTPAPQTSRNRPGWKHHASLILAVHLQRVGLVIAIVGGGTGLLHGWSLGLMNGLLAGLISLLVSLTVEAHAEIIFLTESLQWTWSSLLSRNHLRATFLMTCVIAATIGLSTEASAELSLEPSVLSTRLSSGLSYGLLYWLLLGLFQVVESSQIEDQARRLPNQGIRRSLHNSVLLALISSGFISVIGWLSFELHAWLNFEFSAWLNFEFSAWLSNKGSEVPSGVNIVASFWLSTAPILTLCGGLLVFASRGGLAVLRHYVIRFLLAHAHTFPWRAPRFLEEATARILLRRVGGGYSFPHRLLLDYFADLDHGAPSSLSDGSATEHSQSQPMPPSSG